ncbi:hypothetical protein EII29_05760 [Leptotrichia sp. OH3620_COT-345]|uniref:hypothetical protein n=1 Tax=Leptotrichia sp. OH3620_COT-345 TaxID=2491048 RepID=UPI000F64C8F3|nr:hypothetical protein [Leptotrichia sp. OH3620_COT-345]RRD39763.1 hypothetical protein EII29_05760 [Leptotrichia sp. OH3620_COT-345]
MNKHELTVKNLKVVKKTFFLVMIMLMNINLFSVQSKKNEVHDELKKKLVDTNIKKESKEAFLNAILYIQSDDKKAEEFLLKALKLDKNNYYADTYLNYYKEIEKHKKNLKNTPKDPTVYFVLRALYKNMGKKIEQEQIEKQINLIFPDFPGLDFRKGLEYIEKGIDDEDKEKYKESIKYFKQALEKSKNLNYKKYSRYISTEERDGYVFSSERSIIMAYLFLGEYDMAVEHLEKYYRDMKKINYNRLLYSVGIPFEIYNEKIIKPKSEKLYKKNMEKLKKVMELDKNVN